MSIHATPSRDFMIEFVRERGAKAAYGPKWKMSNAKTIKMLQSLTPQEYMRRCGCDNADESGNCQGHA